MVESLDELEKVVKAFSKAKAGRYAFAVKEIENMSKHFEKIGGCVIGIEKLCHESGYVKATIVISFETAVLDECIAQSRQQGQYSDV